MGCAGPSFAVAISLANDFRSLRDCKKGLRYNTSHAEPPVNRSVSRDVFPSPWLPGNRAVFTTLGIPRCLSPPSSPSPHRSTCAPSPSHPFRLLGTGDAEGNFGASANKGSSTKCVRSHRVNRSLWSCIVLNAVSRRRNRYNDKRVQIEPR
jgi:hypothetical protein